MPTLAVFGAGPGLGRSVAKEFAGHGYDVALISRSTDKLAPLVEQIARTGVQAAAFAADAGDGGTLQVALQQAEDRLGAIDVLEFSPYAGLDMVQPEEVTIENLRPQVEQLLYGAVAAVGQVLPGMLERSRGTLLFTMGGGALNPYPMLAPANAAQAALRNWALNLRQTVGARAVQAAVVAINVMIGDSAPAGVPHMSPDDIAPVFWDLHNDHTRGEHVVIPT